MTGQVEQALEAGFWHIDTAQFYANEYSVGNAIRESGLKRQELYITTKYASGNIRKAAENSLKQIGTSYVDLYLVHFPYTIEKDFAKGWAQIEELKKDKLARSIGVSNFNVEQLQTILKTAKIVPAVNQIRFHPYNYAENKPMLELCAKHNIVVEGYSPLTSITKVPGGPVDKPVQDAADRLGITPAQVILSWVKSKGVVIVTTSSKKSRLDEYIAVGDLPSLLLEEIAAIDEAGAKGPPSEWVHRIKTRILPLAVFSVVAAVVRWVL